RPGGRGRPGLPALGVGGGSRPLPPARREHEATPTEPMIEPLRLSFVVDCPVEHAFDVWTVKTARWWPVTHTVTSEQGLEVVFEGRRGGRIVERTPAGMEVDWGALPMWARPRRLGYP